VTTEIYQLYVRCGAGEKFVARRREMKYSYFQAQFMTAIKFPFIITDFALPPSSLNCDEMLSHGKRHKSEPNEKLSFFMRKKLSKAIRFFELLQLEMSLAVIFVIE